MGIKMIKTIPIIGQSQTGMAPKSTIAKPNNYDNYFSDAPGRVRGSSNYYWMAELSLVGNRNGKRQNIATFIWGYIYVNSQSIPFGPIPSVPSVYQQSLINSKK